MMEDIMDSSGAKFIKDCSYTAVSRGTEPYTVGGPAYPPQTGKLVQLPTPAYPPMTLEKAFKIRRSHRRFTGEPIALETLSWLVWACCGITDLRGDRALRTTPSAGATYAFETLVAVNAVTGLEPGVYVLDVEKFALRQTVDHAVGDALAEACSGQRFLAAAAVNFAWAMIPDRITFRYADRGYRYILLDLGHLGQSMHLAAEAAGLGCCAIGAFKDAEVNTVLEVPPEYPVLYLGTVGVKA
jgi:SagB-type dehydrogenase family enzyme